MDNDCYNKNKLIPIITATTASLLEMSVIIRISNLNEFQNFNGCIASTFSIG